MPTRPLPEVLRLPFVRNSLAIWGGCACVFAICASVLTYLVVHVAPEQASDIQIVAPYYDSNAVNGAGAYLSALPPPARPRGDLAQTTPAPMQRTAYGDLQMDRLHVLSSLLAEYHEEDRKAWVSLTYEPGLETRFLVNHLTGPNACRENLDPQQGPAADGLESVHVTRLSDRDMWLVTLVPDRFRDPLVFNDGDYRSPYSWRPGLYSGKFDCQIQPQTDWATFTTQRVVFAFYSVPPNERADYGLEHFVPARDLNMDLSGLGGAENVSFIGGYASDKSFINVESPERIRTVHLGKSFEAAWQVVNRAEGRDAILVIVGSLIALAAAMLVEAIRPIFEFYLKSDEATPETPVDAG